jgi:hypothetical protein
VKRKRAAGRDKRRSPRGPVSATVVLLERGKRLGSYRVLNLSAGGALLVGRPPSPARELEVLVRLSTGRTVQASATIARQEGADEAAVFAVAFSQVPPADRAVIGEVVLTALEDASDATALIVVAASETGHLLRRELTRLGHPSFVVHAREDALRFLQTPNVLHLALVDLSLAPADARYILSTLAENYPHVRRVALARPSRAARGTRPRAHPLAQSTLPSPWTRDSLARAVRA